MKKRQESGVVLFTALILLVILTLLGLSSMSTNIMEERMAANTQQHYRAFHAAETGLEMAFANDTAFSVGTGVGSTFSMPPAGGTAIIIGGATVAYQVTYTQSGPSEDHFDVRSTATLPEGTRVVLHMGVNVPK